MQPWVLYWVQWCMKQWWLCVSFPIQGVHSAAEREESGDMERSARLPVLHKHWCKCLIWFFSLFCPGLAASLFMCACLYVGQCPGMSLSLQKVGGEKANVHRKFFGPKNPFRILLQFSWISVVSYPFCNSLAVILQQLCYVVHVLVMDFKQLSFQCTLDGHVCIHAAEISTLSLKRQSFCCEFHGIQEKILKPRISRKPDIAHICLTPWL